MLTCNVTWSGDYFWLHAVHTTGLEDIQKLTYTSTKTTATCSASDNKYKDGSITHISRKAVCNVLFIIE